MRKVVNDAIVEVTGSLKLRSREDFRLFAGSPMIHVRNKVLGLRRVNFADAA